MKVPTCTETYYPNWSSRGIRGVKCERPAKVLALVRPFSDAPEWKPKCGWHARRWATTKPLP